MIQRIQTIYLAIATVLIALFVFLDLDLASISAPSLEFGLDAFAINQTVDGVDQKVAASFSIAILALLGLALTVFSIFQFKNRKLQIKLVQACLLFQLGVGALVFVYADKMASLANSEEVSYGPVLAILLVNLALYFLAIRGIKKDEALVRSADRLR